MKFKMPEDISGLSIEELAELEREAWEEYTSIVAKADDKITDEDLADLDKLDEAQTTLAAAREGLEQADQARADKLAAARSKVDAAEAGDDTDAEGDGDDEGDAEGEDEGDGDDADADAEGDDEGADADASEEEKQLVTASAGKRRTVRTATKRTPKPREVIPASGGASLVAAANLPTIASNDTFKDLSAASSVWEQRIAKSPAASSRFQLGIDDARPMELGPNHVQQGFLKIKKADSDFATGLDASVDEQLRIIDAAADERQRFGSDGLAKRALTAAGGWCAPSETMYDFCSYETVSGILDIPTIQIRRGGINFTKGPDYATLAASWGFLQTEAQAIAGTEKVCYPVACPPFAETRMDAVGFCITAGVLTASPGGYPELIRRVLEIGTVAHAHKVNAQVVSRIQTIIGSAVDFTELGSATADILGAIDLAALRMRYSLAMAENATLEVVLPIWAKAIVRADLSRRTGVENFLAVTDQQINSWLAARGVRVQWIYDYQPLAAGNTDTWKRLPNVLEFMMYPAGAFIKGTSPVIDLDTIYDSVGLSTNTYTAAFFEEGLLVANRCGFGVRYSISLAGLSGLTGLTGAAALGGGEGITFAAAA